MKKKTQAFSLIEVLIVIALIGVGATMGVDGMRNYLTTTGLTSNANDLVTSLQLARSASIRLQDRVVICSSENSTTATPSCGDATTPWHAGWIVFHDKNNNAAYDADDDILRVQAATVVNGITITPINLGTSPTNIVNYVGFGPPAGEPTLVDTANQSGIFKICSQSDLSRVRGVSLHFSGRVSTTRTVSDPCTAI